MSHPPQPAAAELAAQQEGMAAAAPAAAADDGQLPAEIADGSQLPSEGAQGWATHGQQQGGAAATPKAPMLPVAAAVNAAGEADAEVELDTAEAGAWQAQGAHAGGQPNATDFSARAAHAPVSWPHALLKLLLLTVLLTCLLHALGLCDLCALREHCADWVDAAKDAWDAAPRENDDGSHLPLVAPSTPRSKRPGRAFRLLHSLVARARAFARMRGTKLGGGPAAGAAGRASGAQLEMAAVKRRQTPVRARPAADLGELPWESPRAMRNLSMPALSRLVSELWVPRLIDSTSDPPALISGDSLRSVCQQVLPRRYAIKDWRLLYSTEQHGCSLHTAYARLAEAGSGPCVLLLLDTAGHIFGAYCSVPPRPDGQYRGTGESCLFSVKPHLCVHRWSQRNELFILGSHDFLAFGSGPAFGLRVDDSFEYGSSGRSDTYEGAECIASGAEFRIVKAELWGFL